MKASTQVAACVALVIGVNGIRAALSTGAACPNITSERLEVLEAFIEAPAGSLDTADFIAAVYEAFAPEAVLYAPETGSYSGVESIAEYALVVDGKFTNGTFQATSYTFNPEEIVIAEDWIQVPHMSQLYTLTFATARHEHAIRTLCILLQQSQHLHTFLAVGHCVGDWNILSRNCKRSRRHRQANHIQHKLCRL